MVPQEKAPPTLLIVATPEEGVKKLNTALPTPIMEGGRSLRLELASTAPPIPTVPGKESWKLQTAWWCPGQLLAGRGAELGDHELASIAPLILQEPGKESSTEVLRAIAGRW